MVDRPSDNGTTGTDIPALERRVVELERAVADEHQRQWIRLSGQLVGLMLWTAMAVTQRSPTPDEQDRPEARVESAQDIGTNRPSGPGCGYSQETAEDHAKPAQPAGEHEVMTPPSIRHPTPWSRSDVSDVCRPTAG